MVGILKDEAKMQEFYNLQKEFNASATVKYQEVTAAKWEYFNLIYKQEGAKVLASAGYKKFLSENKEWLYPYAAFCYLRDKYNNCNFRTWDEYSVYNKTKVGKLFTDAKTKEDVMKRVQEHYDAAVELYGERVLGVFLQGSQNYELDYEGSDVDTKLIVVPDFKNICLNEKPVSTTF